MGGLNKSWMWLMIIGILFLFGYFGYSLYQSLSGADQEFQASINLFSRKTLLSENLKNHLNGTTTEIPESFP